MDYIEKMDALKATVASQEAEIARLKQELDKARQSTRSVESDAQYFLGEMIQRLKDEYEAYRPPHD